MMSIMNDIKWRYWLTIVNDLYGQSITLMGSFFLVVINITEEMIHIKKRKGQSKLLSLYYIDNMPLAIFAGDLYC